MLEGRAGETKGPFAISASGPGTDRGAVGIGFGAMIIGAGAAIPTINLEYNRDLGKVVDFVLSTDLAISTQGFGLLGFIKPGIMVRLAGERSSALGVALRAAPELMLLVGSDGAGCAVGFTPGLELSLGSPSVQVSFGTDVPMYYVLATYGASPKTAWWTAGSPVSSGWKVAAVILP